MISFRIRSSRALSIFDLGMVSWLFHEVGDAQLVPESCSIGLEIEAAARSSLLTTSEY
jgi:hypothetical protein